MKAREIMTSNPSVVTPDEPVSRAAELMRELNVGLLPVVDDRSSMRLQGVITDRDLAIRCVAEKHDAGCPVRNHMTTNRIDTVRPDTDVSEVMQTMEREQVRRIPVVNDDAQLTGIIAQADIALRLTNKDPKQVANVVERVSEPVKQKQM
ncbi:MAG TPA: CBS domain-containing protein [Gemmatimonadaceae bacterium]|nr:CBS domain-containing protein [Gemmatimonadaceae bacterium]